MHEPTLWHTNSDFYGVRTPLFMPCEPFLLGVGVVFNLLMEVYKIQSPSWDKEFQKRSFRWCMPCVPSIVARIARPTSLAIWHRVHFHCRPCKPQIRVRIASISHRLIVNNMPNMRIAGQHRRIFAESFVTIFMWTQRAT